jgi:ribokinase
VRIARVRVAVVGHVEWIEFARVERVPRRGEIVRASESWEEAGGGGAVAAARLAALAGSCTFFVALGDDWRGRRSVEELERLGVRVEAAFRPEPQRRGFVYLDAGGERTITVIDEKMHPQTSEPLPWDELEGYDAVYYCAGEPDAIRAARRARVVVTTARELARLRAAAVDLDAVVASASDESEVYRDGALDPAPRLVVRTEGSTGGSFAPGDGRYEAAPLPGPLADAYGAGDSFAAGLAYGLGAGMSADDALAVAAREGALALTRRGAHGPLACVGDRDDQR